MSKNKGSGSKQGATMAAMPEAKPTTDGKAKILVTMLIAAEGLNAQELGRFVPSVAEKLIKQGKAELYRSPTNSVTKTGIAVTKAVKALHAANDAKRLMADRMKSLIGLIEEADQLTQEAFDAADSDLAGNEGGVEILQAQHEDLTVTEAEAVAKAEAEIKELKSNHSKAKKTLPKAEDKEACQALIDEAALALDGAEKALEQLQIEQVAASEARVKAIDEFEEDSTLSDAVNANIAELEKLIAETRELDEELNG